MYGKLKKEILFLYIFYSFKKLNPDMKVAKALNLI